MSLARRHAPTAFHSRMLVAARLAERAIGTCRAGPRSAFGQPSSCRLWVFGVGGLTASGANLAGLDLLHLCVGHANGGRHIVAACLNVVGGQLLAPALELGVKLGRLGIGDDVLGGIVVVADGGIVIAPGDAALFEIGLLGLLDVRQLGVCHHVLLGVAVVVRVLVVLDPLKPRLLGLGFLGLLNHLNLGVGDGVLFGDGILAQLHLLLQVLNPRRLKRGRGARLLLGRDAERQRVVVVRRLFVVLDPLLAVGLSLGLHFGIDGHRLGRGRVLLGLGVGATRLVLVQFGHARRLLAPLDVGGVAIPYSQVHGLLVVALVGVILHPLHARRLGRLLLGSLDLLLLLYGDGVAERRLPLALRDGVVEPSQAVGLLLGLDGGTLQGAGGTGRGAGKGRSQPGGGVRGVVPSGAGGRYVGDGGQPGSGPDTWLPAQE
eukprot:scaffold1214_cov136-Isochrysis_galbana.AAC.2